MPNLASLAAQDVAWEYAALSLADLPVGAGLVFAAASTEERGRHPVWEDALAQRRQDCFEISPDSGGPDLPYTIAVSHAAGTAECTLRDNDAILAALHHRNQIFIDISGLTHQTWASLLRALVSAVPRPRLSVIYVEPHGYRSHPSPSTFGSFDLSVGFSGIRPIPGFARLARRVTSRRRVFVPLLGFEGSRPRLVHSELDASIVAPIVGLPGFRIDFPAVAVACNQQYLDEIGGYGQLRYARGSCPFAVFSVLSEITRDLDADHLQIAPLGTKPQALGAFLFALRRPDLAEIVYDHPIRRAQRTQGIGLTHVFDVSRFVDCW